jgi:hypothetical protein
MNSSRWFYLAVAALVIFAYGVHRFTSQGRYVFKPDTALVLDTWTGTASGVVNGEVYRFGESRSSN